MEGLRCLGHSQEGPGQASCVTYAAVRPRSQPLRGRRTGTRRGLQCGATHGETDTVASRSGLAHRARDPVGVAAVDTPAARIAEWGRFSNDGAPAKNHGAIMLSKIMQPNAELGMNGQNGLISRRCA